MFHRVDIALGGRRARRILLAQMPADGQAPKIVEPAEAKNMRLVGIQRSAGA